MVVIPAKEVIFDEFDKTKYRLSSEEFKKYCDKYNKLQKQKLDNDLQFSLPYTDEKNS